MAQYKIQLLVCGGAGCSASRSHEVMAQLDKELESHGLKDFAKVVPTGCFGFCEKGPIVKVVPDNTFYIQITPEDAKEIIEEHIIKGRKVNRLVGEQVKLISTIGGKSDLMRACQLMPSVDVTNENRRFFADSDNKAHDSKNNIGNSFFVIYPKAGYAETEKIIRDITGRLGVGYQLWSYADVRDEYEYYQTVVEPAIEKAEFVLVFLAKGAEKEYLVSEPVRLCSNMNKSMVPIKLKNSDVKEKNWNFRSKLIDIQDERQVTELEEKMRAWLGLAIEFIDLGLPSGTLWKYKNESGFYEYDLAVCSFGSKLPTKGQFEELKNLCQWMWIGNGYKVVGPSGASIVLPAAGYRNCNGGVYRVGSSGDYWSCIPNDSRNAWSLSFYSDEVGVDDNSRSYGLSVRLVQN